MFFPKVLLGLIALVGVQSAVAQLDTSNPFSIKKETKSSGDAGFYIGAGIGRASINAEDDQLNLGFDDTENVYLLRGGLMLSNWIGIEIGYYNFDEYDELAGTVIEGLDISNVNDATLELEAYTAAIVFNLPLKYVDLYVKGGAAILDGKASAQIGNNTRIEAQETRTEPYAVVGAELDFGKINFFTEYTRIIDTDDIEVDFVTSGIKYEF